MDGWVGYGLLTVFGLFTMVVSMKQKKEQCPDEVIPVTKCFPAGTWRRNDVVLTLMQRHHVDDTSF